MDGSYMQLLLASTATASWWTTATDYRRSTAKHRSAQAQADLMTIRARAGLVRARTGLVNTARGLAKSYGERLRGCNVRNMNPEKAEGLSPELQRALEPLLAGIEAVSERIVEYNERIEQLAQQSYPQTALLKQVKGVGTLIALTYMLTIDDPHRFQRSREVGCYLGLRPRQKQSGPPASSIPCWPTRSTPRAPPAMKRSRRGSWP